jgi:hypothetical protein
MERTASPVILLARYIQEEYGNDLLSSSREFDKLGISHRCEMELSSR